MVFAEGVGAHTQRAHVVRVVGGVAALACVLILRTQLVCFVQPLVHGPALPARQRTERAHDRHVPARHRVPPVR